MQRRQFLGAAAALSGLPASPDAAEDDSDADDGNDADDSSDAGGDTESADASDYDRTTVVRTSGGLEVPRNGNTETTVKVSSHPEGIGLELSNDIGEMNVLLLPGDIDPLCRELRDAKTKTQPDEVEQSREWLTADYRDRANSTND